MEWFLVLTKLDVLLKTALALSWIKVARAFTKFRRTLATFAKQVFTFRKENV